MEALTWIVIGLIAGWFAARLIYSALGMLRILIVGLFGAVVGLLVFARLGIHTVPDVGAALIAGIGAIVLLWIWRAIRRA